MKRGIFYILTFLLIIVYSIVEAKDDYDLAYYGENTKFEINEGVPITITLHFAENDDDLQENWQYWNSHDPIKQKWSVRGFSLIKENECIIVIPKFNKWDDRSNVAVLGHELLHCFGGNHGLPIKFN